MTEGLCQNPDLELKIIAYIEGYPMRSLISNFQNLFFVWTYFDIFQENIGSRQQHQKYEAEEIKKRGKQQFQLVQLIEG